MWEVAQTFPGSKESVYPEHADAHGFDTLCNACVVLEFGCGNGSDVASMLQRGAEVWYTDHCAANVEATKARIGRYATPVKHEELYKIHDKKFDRVNCHGVLHHIENPVPAILEIHRLLKNNGSLYAMLYTEKMTELLSYQYALNLKRGHKPPQALCMATDGVPGYARLYTEAEGKELFESCGFMVVRSVEYNKGQFRTFQAVAL